MNDLISRQAAIDAVFGRSHDIIKQRLKNLPSARPEPIKVSVDREMTEEELKELKKKIADSPVVLLPSAQPEIIRCKDCKYGSPNGKYGCKCYHYRLYETHEMKPEDFCSRVERRTDG